MYFINTVNIRICLLSEFVCIIFSHSDVCIYLEHHNEICITFCTATFNACTIKYTVNLSVSSLCMWSEWMFLWYFMMINEFFDQMVLQVWGFFSDLKSQSEHWVSLLNMTAVSLVKNDISVLQLVPKWLETKCIILPTTYSTNYNVFKRWQIHIVPPLVQSTWEHITAL